MPCLLLTLSYQTHWPWESPLTSPKNSPWLTLLCWEWQLSWQQQHALKCQVKSFHCLSEYRAMLLKCTMVCVSLFSYLTVCVASCVHLYLSMWATQKELSLPFPSGTPVYIILLCNPSCSAFLMWEKPRKASFKMTTKHTTQWNSFSA